MVGAGTFMLTRFTGTFVGIWNETMSKETSLFYFSVLWSMVDSRLKALQCLDGDSICSYIQEHNEMFSLIIFIQDIILQLYIIYYTQNFQ